MISVLMSVFNEKLEFLDLAVKSILNQTYSNLELIIVNDNPEKEEYNEYLKNLAKKDNRVRLIKNENNLGLPKSLNKAFNLASGNYIARMDSDDISSLIRFEKQIKFLSENPEIDLVASSTQDIDENGIEIKKQPIIELNNKEISRIIKYASVLKHPTWLMKRDVFEKLKGYRNLRYGQDYDFLYRAIDRGFNVYLLGDMLLKYRVRNNSIGSTAGVKQFLTAEYVKELHKRRMSEGHDSFSEREWNNWINISKDEKEKFDKVHKYFRENNNKSLKIIVKKLWIGITLSNYYKRLMKIRIKLRASLFLIKMNRGIK